MRKKEGQVEQDGVWGEEIETGWVLSLRYRSACTGREERFYVGCDIGF